MAEVVVGPFIYEDIIDVSPINYQENIEIPVMVGLNGLSSYQLWILQEGNEGKTYQEYEQWQRQPSLTAGEYATEQGDYAKTQGDYAKEEGDRVDEVIDLYEVALTAVNNATERSNKLSDNPPRIETVNGVNYWSFWSEDTEEYVVSSYLADVFIDKGVYDSQVTYSKKEMVTTIDSSYVSKTDSNLGNPVTDTVNWKCIANGRPSTLAAELAIEVATHPNTIVNDIWFSWNTETNQYVSTGIRAKGDTYYSTFSIDPTTGLLTMRSDSDFTNTTFVLTDGKLILQITT